MNNRTQLDNHSVGLAKPTVKQEEVSTLEAVVEIQANEIIRLQSRVFKLKTKIDTQTKALEKVLTKLKED